MTTEHVEHKGVFGELGYQLSAVLRQSPDGVYLWLDENHMVCNEKLAKMFGYTVAEFCAKKPFIESFVAKEDRELFSLNYRASVGSFAFPVTFRFKGVRKTGERFLAEMDMVPLSWNGHAVAYTFVREIK
ncbi:MAG: PAS domain-containing protein [Candidatus Micrarchaeia archaeon]